MGFPTCTCFFPPAMRLPTFLRSGIGPVEGPWMALCQSQMAAVGSEGKAASRLKKGEWCAGTRRKKLPGADATRARLLMAISFIQRLGKASQRTMVRRGRKGLPFARAGACAGCCGAAWGVRCEGREGIGGASWSPDLLRKQMGCVL